MLFVWCCLYHSGIHRQIEVHLQLYSLFCEVTLFLAWCFLILLFSQDNKTGIISFVLNWSSSWCYLYHWSIDHQSAFHLQPCCRFEMHSRTISSSGWLLCFSLIGSTKITAAHGICAFLYSVKTLKEKVNEDIQFLKCNSRKFSFPSQFVRYSCKFMSIFPEVFLCYSHIVGMLFFVKNRATKWCYLYCCSYAVAKVTVI